MIVLFTFTSTQEDRVATSQGFIRIAIVCPLLAGSKMYFLEYVSFYLPEKRKSTDQAILF